MCSGIGIHAVAAQAIMLAMTERYFMLSCEGNRLTFDKNERVVRIQEQDTDENSLLMNDLDEC